MVANLRKSLIVGTYWSLIGQVGYLFVNLVTNITLARIVGPQAFGQIGVVMFFIVIGKVISESGLSGALIRKQDVNDEDYSTVFLFNLFISIAIFVFFFIIAGIIANYYDDPLLKDLLRVSSLILIINSFQIVNKAKLEHGLNYKKKTKIELIAIIISSVISIYLAIFHEAGVWAVVVLQLLTPLIITTLLWFHFGVLKKIVFSRNSFKLLYRFGLNTTLASIINTAFENVYQLILGKFFAIQQTGFYYQAKKLQEVPVRVIKSTTLGVVYATLSKLQDDLNQFSRLYNKVITLFTIAIGYICLVIFFYANELILILYGEEWLGSVFYIQVLIAASFFYMQEMFNRVIFKVFNRTDKILHLEFIKKTIQAATIVIGIFFHRIDILLYGFLLTSIVSYFINYYVSRKIYGGFSWYEILLLVKVISILSFIFAGGALLKTLFSIDNYYSFILLPFISIGYILLVRLFQISNIQQDMLIIKDLIIKKNA